MPQHFDTNQAARVCFLKRRDTDEIESVVLFSKEELEFVGMYDTWIDGYMGTDWYVTEMDALLVRSFNDGARHALSNEG